MTPSPDLDALERLLGEATAGEWEAMEYDDHSGDEGCCILVGGPGPARRATAYTIAYPWTTPASCEADAALIVAAVNALPALVVELRASRAALAGVADLHTRSGRYAHINACRECKRTWPCATALAAAPTPNPQET